MNDVAYLHGQEWFEAWLTYYIDHLINESRWYRE